jgi:hypothetical protein
VKVKSGSSWGVSPIVKMKIPFKKHKKTLFSLRLCASALKSTAVYRMNIGQGSKYQETLDLLC